MVKSFYDPKIEERGIQKGRVEKEEEARLKDVERVIKLLTKKFKEIDEDKKQKICEASDDKLGNILDNILDIENLEEAMKYL